METVRTEQNSRGLVQAPSDKLFGDANRRMKMSSTPAQDVYSCFVDHVLTPSVGIPVFSEVQAFAFVENSYEKCFASNFFTSFTAEMNFGRSSSRDHCRYTLPIGAFTTIDPAPPSS
jgi:hypothetical protein